MPKKTLVDLAELRKEIKGKLTYMVTEKKRINPENPVVEKLGGIELAYDNVLDYLRKCQKYDSQGRKVHLKTNKYR